MTVLLLSIGRDRFELYSEPPEDPIAPVEHDAGRLRQWAHRAGVRWRELVEAARHGGASGRLARWRDAAVRKLAETIAEQRTLWALGSEQRATLLVPSGMERDAARATLNRLLDDARRHHLLWFSIDVLLFIVSALLALVPGPNLLAYYLAFRAFGHLRSWRGARQGQRIEWTIQPDASLAELASLVSVPRDVRASRVDAIAARLNLHRLSAFFERVAA